jgi:SpoVK/Ycf46/Vps4 family AAA+-type ATPase
MSKWVGETEKNLRDQFKEYRHFQEKLDPAPILFLNECDQILNRRISVNQSVDQMRNTMQNMLLEELETFHGILMATTNMTQNLDAAFERRFLYKLRFNMPSQELLARHWKAALPRLTEAQSQFLATEFAYSPGEMQNISTKVQLRRMLNTKLKYFNAVLELCKEEKWGEEKKQEMGFR